MNHNLVSVLLFGEPIDYGQSGTYKVVTFQGKTAM
jgi:hypothetical protein